VLDGKVRAFSLLLNRYSRSTGIPARTRAKAAAGFGTQNVSVVNGAVFDPEAIADMTNNLTRLERALCEFVRHTYNDHRLWRRIAIPAKPMRVHPADCPRQPQRRAGVLHMIASDQSHAIPHENHRGTPNTALDSCIPAKTFL
jgi:hypothetical protein